MHWSGLFAANAALKATQQARHLGRWVLADDSGLVVMDVRPESKADVRKGDVLLTLVHKGQHSELRSVEQFNKILAGLDKSAVITLQLRRGESMAFVTISGLIDKG